MRGDEEVAALDPPVTDSSPPMWQLTGEEAAAALDVDPDRGLSADEAASRLLRHGPNRLDEAAGVPGWRRFRSQLADPLIYLLLAAVVISVGAWLAEGGVYAIAKDCPTAAIVLLNADDQPIYP